MAYHVLFFSTVLLINFVCLSAHFDFSLWYCRFRCDSRCNKPESNSPFNNMKPIQGYYWRDYHGVIPIDAFPLGPPTQFPQTYIALVYDKIHNGTFITTLVKGLNYAYNSYNGTVSKIDKHIQILCTMQPERLIWIRLTKENVKTRRPGDIIVTTSHHYVQAQKKRFYHYVVRAAKCGVNYAGNVKGFLDKMEYALMDGSKSETKAFLWLIYRPSKGTYDKQGINKDEPFFSHHYEYQMGQDSIIPQFYKRLKIGSCSITCTNQGADSKSGTNKNKAAKTAMAYYWKPKRVLDTNEAFKAGYKNRNQTVFIGQSYFVGLNWYEVGTSTVESLKLIGETYSANEYTDIQIFSTQTPKKFIWINSTSDTFTALDNSTLIPGGMMDNGTEIFVGRAAIKDKYQDKMLPGSIRVFKDQTLCYIDVYQESKFEVLQYKDE